MDSFNKEFVSEILGHIKKLLPIQAPLPSFIHNNILQAFEHHPFLEGVVEAGVVYHSKSFMDEDYYLEALEKGRINTYDLDVALKNKYSTELLTEKSNFFDRTKEELYLSLLTAPPQYLPQINIEWIIGQETDEDLFHHKADREHIKSMEKKFCQHFKEAGYKTMKTFIQSLRSAPGLHQNVVDYLFHLQSSEKNYLAEIEKRPHRLMISILWSFSLFTLAKSPQDFTEEKNKKGSLRFRDFIIQKYAENYDDFLNPFIIRMLSSYMDQGLSYWPAPHKELGLWKHFEGYFLAKGRVLTPYYSEAAESMSHYQQLGYSFDKIIWMELSKSPYPQHKWQAYLTELLLDLRGWAGMINRLENEPALAPVKCPKLSLEEFVAIRLILERAAVEYYLKKHNLRFNDRSLLKAQKKEYSVVENAFLFLETLMALELETKEIFSLTPNHVHFISNLLKDFSLQTRKNIYQEAFEHHLTAKGLHAIKLSSQKKKEKEPIRFQTFHCMDDREEALRRYLEESGLGIETYGTLGFYNVDMNYVKINHPRKIPQCPVVMKPRKVVREVPKPNFKMQYLKAQKSSINVGRAQLLNYYSGRTLIRGFFSTLILGIPSLFPLSFRILAPSKAKALDKYLAKFFITQIETDIAVDQKLDYQTTELNHGFSYEEMRDLVVTILRGMGLVKNFAKTVFVIGHGSSSVNNAHIMAYGCGACGGNPGAPNARAFAKIINMPEVRQLIREVGIDIPHDTYFIGAYHDTCSDEMSYQDIESIPVSHLEDFKVFCATMTKALTQNAYERTRWFKNAPLKLTPTKAIHHVKSRSLSLAEPRPEYGHSNVAFAILGRRELTKNLFLDRRAFLVSYDPTIDDEEGSILSFLLAGSVPVGAGISLDYFFSHVDSDRYGCGSKLPLNLSSMIGVISGASSDLRLGLPRQSVDIHEPVRLTVIVEVDHEKLVRLVSKSPRQLLLVMNSWIFVFTIHPETKVIHQFKNGKFVEYHDPITTLIPEVDSSASYVKDKKRNSLDFVFTGKGAQA
ncbi:MAG: putative inorganic carbon transporter subunit DabA [Bacteriovoracaceae bacterium]